MFIKILDIFFIRKTRTNMSINQTTLNMLPILGIHHILLQPIRVIPKPILLEPFPRNPLPDALIRHNYAKHRESDQAEDQNVHNNQVQVQKNRNPTTRTDDSEQRDDKKGQT